MDWKCCQLPSASARIEKRLMSCQDVAIGCVGTIMSIQRDSYCALVICHCSWRFVFCHPVPRFPTSRSRASSRTRTSTSSCARRRKGFNRIHARTKIKPREQRGARKQHPECKEAGFERSYQVEQPKKTRMHVWSKRNGLDGRTDARKGPGQGSRKARDIQTEGREKHKKRNQEQGEKSEIYMVV